MGLKVVELREPRRRGGSQKGRKRVHSSCEPCRARKVKCDRLAICTSCRLHGQACFYHNAEPLLRDENEPIGLAEMNAEIMELRNLLHRLSSYPELEEEYLENADPHDPGYMDVHERYFERHRAEAKDEQNPKEYYPSPPVEVFHRQNNPTPQPLQFDTGYPHTSSLREEEERLFMFPISHDVPSSTTPFLTTTPLQAPMVANFASVSHHIPPPPSHPAHMFHEPYYQQAIHSEQGQVQLIKALERQVY